MTNKIEYIQRAMDKYTAFNKKLQKNISLINTIIVLSCITICFAATPYDLQAVLISLIVMFTAPLFIIMGSEIYEKQQEIKIFEQEEKLDKVMKKYVTDYQFQAYSTDSTTALVWIYVNKVKNTIPQNWWDVQPIKESEKFGYYDHVRISTTGKDLDNKVEKAKLQLITTLQNTLLFKDTVEQLKNEANLPLQLIPAPGCSKQYELWHSD